MSADSPRPGRRGSDERRAPRPWHATAEASDTMAREATMPATGGHVRRVAAVALAVAVTILAALSTIPVDSRSSGERAPYSSTFPAGPGKTIAERACLFCHSPMLVTQQAKDSTAWEKTLTTMQTWGTPMTPAEQDTLRGYLLTHFGPRTQVPQ